MIVTNTLVFLVVPTAVVVGVILGYRNRKHRHTWTMWSRVWDDDKQELTMVQERSCTGCGFQEKNDPTPQPQCPPHEWGAWGSTPVSVSDGRGGRRDVGGQSRTCVDCGIEQLRKVTDGNHQV